MFDNFGFNIRPNLVTRIINLGTSESYGQLQARAALSQVATDRRLGGTQSRSGRGVKEKIPVPRESNSGRPARSRHFID
jgi:hypothetical protein